MNFMNQQRINLIRTNPISDSFKFRITGDQPAKEVMILKLFGKIK